MCLLGGCTIAGRVLKNFKLKARSNAHTNALMAGPRIFYAGKSHPHDYLRKPSLWTTVL